MNEKDISKLRRRISPDKCNIGQIRCCYVNEKHEPVSQLRHSLGLMPAEQTEKILSVLKKVLSGQPGRNLIDIPFTNEQVLSSREHKLLSTLRACAICDDEAVQALFESIAQSLTLEGSYLILLAYDTYDIFKTDEGAANGGESEQMFSYIICAVCPVKETKPALSYYVHENRFRSLCQEQIITVPEIGFVFPAFDDGRTNIYNALYYTRSTEDNHPEFASAVFNSEIPMPAAAQKQTFNSVLSESVAGECSYEVAAAVHDRLYDMIEEHRATKSPQVQTVSKSTLKKVLEDCGVPEQRLESFEEKYDAEFGEGAEISAQNLVCTKQLELRTPEVTIRVAPERSDLVQTRIIDGERYILIRAECGVEVNGVSIRIAQTSGDTPFATPGK